MTGAWMKTKGASYLELERQLYLFIYLVKDKFTVSGSIFNEEELFGVEYPRLKVLITLS